MSITGFAIATVGAIGAGKTAHALHNNQEAKEMIEAAESRYKNAIVSFDAQKQSTSKALEDLGKLKLDAWSNDMTEFLNSFNLFKNVVVNYNTNSNLNLLKDISRDDYLINIENATSNASEIMKVGFSSLGAGAIVGVASYGGAMMFASASTGTAISALSGAAATNATLAWFGGGSLASGGAGIVGGKLILGGIVAAPILAVAGILLDEKSKEKIANAEKIRAEADEATEKIGIMTTYMSGIETASNDYLTFIKNFRKKFSPILNAVNDIGKKYSENCEESVSFDMLTDTEQKTLHIAWLMAQIYYQVLSAPILNENGDLHCDAVKSLKEAKVTLKKTNKDIKKIASENVEISNILWEQKTEKIRKKALVVSIILAVIGIVGIITGHGFAMIGLIGGGVIACPLIYDQILWSEKKRYYFCFVRIIVGIIVSLCFL